MSGLRKLRPGLTSQTREAPALALAVAALAAASVSLVTLQSNGGTAPQGLPSFLRGALGPAAASAPAPPPTAHIGRRDFGLHGVTLEAASSAAAPWRHHRDGVTRATAFGHDTVVVAPGKVEELLTVTRRQGLRTWRWRIGASGLTPRLGDDGAVSFVSRHRLAPTSIAPVEILDARGRPVTPDGLRWSLRRSHGAWWLELRLDDRDLPLPYVVDPAISFRSSATATTTGAASITINVPAGVAAGDVMLAQIAVRNTPTISSAGWTSVVRTTNGTVAQEIFRKKATASEPASYTFTLSASNKAVGGIAAYVGVDSSTSNGIDAAGGNLGTGTAVTAPSVATSRAGDVVAAFWSTATNTTLPADGSTTQRWTLQSGGGGAKHTGTAADYTFAGTGGTGTKVATAGASTSWVADQVALYLDNTPPQAPNPTIAETSTDSYAPGTTFYYRPGGGATTFTVTEGATDPESGVKQVTFPGVAGGFTPTTPTNDTSNPYSQAYTLNGGSDSGSKTITVADNAGGTSTTTFTITPDPSVPTPSTTFPGTGAYKGTTWAAGCAPVGFCGTTAADGGSGLASVDVSIRRESTGLYWSGGAFASGAQVFQPAAGTTSWSYGFAASSFPADGTYTVTVRATDNVSNVATASRTFTWDTTAPLPPGSLAVAPASPANDNAPKLSGSAEAGSTVTLYTDAACTGPVAASGTAAAFSSPGLAAAVADNSTTTFYVTATDAAGNVSPCSGGVPYVEDSTAPLAPGSLALSPSSPANDNAPKVSGSAEAGSTVKLYTNASCTSAVAASGTAAAFSAGLAVAVADNSTTTFYATATDAAGNASLCSSGVTYTEDSAQPVAPGSLSLSPASPADDNAPKVRGSAEAGSTVKLYTNPSCTSAVAASGTAATFSSPGLAVSVADDSSTTFYATATDAAGNVSLCSTGIAYVEDSTVPSSTVTFPAGGAIYRAATWNAGCSSALCGTASDAGGLQRVELSIRRAGGSYWNGGSFGSGSELWLTATGTTSWSYGFPASSFPADDSYVVHTRAVDAAGHVESFSSRTVTFDAGAPTGSVTAPTAAWVRGSSVTVGSNSADTGSGVQQATFEVSPAGGGSWSSIGTSGSWPYSVSWNTTAVANGSYDLRVVTTDAAGNSATSAATAVGVDNAAPTSTLTVMPGTRADLQYWNAATGTYYYNPAATGDLTVVDAAADTGGSGVARVDFGALSTTGFSGGATSATSAPYSSGTYTFTSANTTAPALTVTAVDAAGNTATASPAFVRDAAAPTGMSASVTGGWATTESVTVTLDAGSDAGAGVASASGIVERDSTSLSGGTCGSFAGSWAPVTLAGGADTTVQSGHCYRYRYSVADRVGNRGTQPDASATVKVDADGPSAPSLAFSGLTSSSAGGGTVYYRPGAAGGFTVTAVADDPQSGVASYTYPDLGAGWTHTGGDYTFNAGADDPAEPNDVTARNGAGLDSAPASFTVTADSQAPTSTVACDGASCAGWHTGAPVSVTLAASDSGSGVAQILYSTDGSAPSTVYVGAFDVSSTTTVRYAAVDRVGNVESTGSELVQVDATPPAAPSLAFSGLTNVSVGSGTVYYRPDAAGGFTVTAVADDPQSGVASYTYPDLGPGWTHTGGDYTFNAGADDPAEPNDVTARNGAGLDSAPTSFTVTADSQAPTTTVACDGASCAGWHTGAPVSVTLAASDSGSGGTQVRYTTDGSDPTLLNGQTYLAPFDVSETTTVKFRAYDAVGNAEPVSAAEVRIDTTAPVLAAAAAASGDTFWNAGAGTLWYRPGGSGSFDLTATLSDDESGAAAVDFPALAGFGPGGTDAGSPFESAYTYSGSPSQPGTITIHGRNGAGLETTAPLDVKADGSAPAGGSISYPGGYSATGSVALTVDSGTDAESGLAAGGAAIERSSAPLSDGSCGTYGSWAPVTSPDSPPDGTCARYRYRVADRVGNVALFTSPNVARVDLTAPTAPALTLSESSPYEHVAGTTLYYNPQGANSASFTVQAATTDGESGIDHVDFPSVFGADGGPDAAAPYSTAYSWTAAATATGTQSVDAWNGAGLDSSASFTVTPDTTAPADGSVDYPDGFSASPVTVTTADGSDSGSGLDAASTALERRSASLSGSSCGPWGTWQPATSPDALPGNTCAQYRYRISDHVGNEAVYASANVVRTDAAAPTVTLDDPGANLRSAVTLQASADDDGSGVESVRFEIAPAGSASWTAIDTDTSAPYTAALDTATLGDGLYDLRAIARDRAGNTTTSDVVGDRRVDNTPPSVSLGDPGSILSGTVALSATADDLGGSGVASVRYEISAAGLGSWSTVPASWDTSGSGDGLYDVRAVATDMAGNTALSEVWTNVRVDDTPPTVDLHDPGANVAGTVALGADVDDGDGSGVASVTYEYSAAGANDWTTTPGDWDTTALEDGLYDLRATVTDRAGNAATSALVIGVRVDNAPPTVAVSSPADGSYVNALAPDPRPVTATALDSGSGIDHVDLFACSDSSVDCATGTWNALGTATAGPYRADWPLPADGPRALRAVAVDRTGHEASDVVTVTVDRTPPETDLAGTPSDPSNDPAPDVSFGSNESDATFECRVDGGLWQSCTSPTTLEPLADGSHTAEVRATDPAGNVDATPASWTWLVDTTPPTATMDDPGRVVRGSVALTSISDDPGASASGVATVAYEYSADGGATWAPTPDTWNTTAVEDGVYELRVVVADRAANTTASTPVADVRVDNTAPTTSLDDLAANVRQTIALNGAAADTGSGVAQVQFEVSPAGASTWLPIGVSSATPYSVELDTTTLADGVYDFRTVALDVAGNEGDGLPVTGIRVDNTPPTVSLGDPGANLRRTVTLAGGADDAGGSGVATVTYEYSAAGAGDWHAASESWNTFSVADGVYDLRAVATDVAGNSASSPLRSSRVDNTPPATTDDAPSGWQSTPVTVTLSASDAGSGPSATEYSVDGGSFQAGTSVTIPAPSDGSNDGAHTIAYFSTDVAGNVESVRSTDVLVEASPPGSRPTDPGAYLSGTVTLGASPSARSGIASVAFQYSRADEGGGDGNDWTTIATDTSAPWSATWDTTSVGDGAYDLRFVVTDRAVPANVTQTTLPAKIVDNTAPTGTIGAPAAGSTVSGDVRLSAAAADATSRVASVEFRLNGSTVGTATSAPYRVTWDSTSVGDGSASVDAVITDLAGNTFTTGSRAFTVDNLAPTPTLADPGSAASGTVTLQAASDPDTADVEFQRSPAGANDWTPIATDTSAPFSVSFVTTGIPDGRYDLRALATDGSGHRGASAARTLLVDNTAPTASLTTPADGATVGGRAALTAAADDGSGSGVASVAFEERPASGGAWATIGTAGSAPYTATWDTSSVASGSYQLRAVATDGAGNRANGRAIAVTVDSTAPTVALDDPGSPLSGAVTLTASAGASATRVAFEWSRAGAASWTTIATDTSAPWSAAFDTRSVGDGVYDLRAVASDVFGNTRASVRSGIRIDNSAPRLVSSTPPEGATVAAASAIVLVASESLERVTGLSLNGRATVPPVVTGSRVDLATGDLREGAYTLAGVLHDLAGKTAPFELHFTISSGGSSDPPPVSGNTSSDDAETFDASDGSASVTVPKSAWAERPDGDWVVVTIDPRPASNGLLQGYLSEGRTVEITARWALSGEEIHRFDAPLEIVLRNARPDDVPATSEGGAWRVIPALAGTTLPAGLDDGFYRSGDTVRVLTRHLSLFALLRDVEGPAAPSGFRGVVSSGQLTLSWTPAPDGGATDDKVVLYAGGAEIARYPTSQKQAGLGPFGFDDARTFSLAQVDGVGNVGPRTVVLRGVPDVAGKPQADAAAALAGRGFRVGLVTSESSPEPVGTVLAPSSAAVAADGSAIDLVVSSGPDGGGSAGDGLPFRLRVAQSKTFAWRTQRAIGARLRLTRRADVSAVLESRSGEALRTWTFPAKAGATVVRLLMPSGLRRPGVYRVAWTVRSGELTKITRLALRVVGRSRAATAVGRRDVVVAGRKALRKKLAQGLPASVRVSAAGVDGTFDLTASWSSDVRVVVVDLDEHGVGLVRDLRTVFPDVRLAALGGDTSVRRAATRAGAAATLPRSASAKQLARVVSRLLAR